MTAGGMMCCTTLKVSPVGSEVIMGVRETRTHKPIFPYETADGGYNRNDRFSKLSTSLWGENLQFLSRFRFSNISLTYLTL
jgi:hypothetical protein